VKYNKEPGASVVEMDYPINLKSEINTGLQIPNYDIDKTCDIQFDLQIDSTGSIIQISVNKEKTTCKGESIIADLSERIQDEVKFSKHTNDSTIEKIYFVTLFSREIKEFKKIADSLIEELKQLRQEKKILDSMVSSWNINIETYKNYRHHRNKIYIDPASDYYKKFLKKIGFNTKSLVEVLPDSAYIRIYKPFKHHSYSEFQVETYQLSEYESMILSKSKMQGTIKVLENNDVVLQEIIGISEFNFNAFNDKEITSWAIISKNIELERTQKYIAILENKNNQLTTLNDTIFEEDAEFPGGYEKLAAFINETINYPDEAIEFGVKGRVVVRFVVEKDGRISNASVEHPIVECPACNKEALNIIKNMPKWVPATNSGRPVRLWVRFPINFDVQ
jgi:TonB family protein